MVLVTARYPRRSAGMTELWGAGVTELARAGGRRLGWAVAAPRRVGALGVAWVPACAGMTEGGAGMTEGGAGIRRGRRNDGEGR